MILRVRIYEEYIEGYVTTVFKPRKICRLLVVRLYKLCSVFAMFDVACIVIVKNLDIYLPLYYRHLPGFIRILLARI